MGPNLNYATDKTYPLVVTHPQIELTHLLDIISQKHVIQIWGNRKLRGLKSRLWGGKNKETCETFTS